jgi:beta-phosphoglucomutase-like phosphatase (HAD superfamily)
MKYILFDCDGNVIDSEKLAMPIASEYLVSVAQRQGVSVPDATVLSLFGKPINVMMNTLSQGFGVVFKDGVEQEIHQETVRVLSEKTQPVAGIGAFLEVALGRGFKPVIVTSSSFDRVYAGLECAGLKPYFPDDMIFSAVSSFFTPRPKPHIAVYCYTLNHFGIEPHETFTSEDSLSGGGSAKGAKIPWYGNLAGRHLDGIREKHAESMLKAGAVATFSHWREMIDVLPARAGMPRVVQVPARLNALRS